MGFLRLMAEEFPGLKVVGVREGRDDADTNYRLTLALLKQHPDLVGLYNIGGGAEGVGRSTARAVVFASVSILVLDALIAAALASYIGA